MRWNKTVATPHPTSPELGHLPLKGKAFANVKRERYMKATGDVARAHSVRRSERKEAPRSTIAPR